MKNKIFFVVGMLFMVLVLIYVVSLTNTNQSSTEGVKSKQAPKAYINKEKPTAIYIEGNPKPVLTIEDLPKEFPSHVHHMEGATPRHGSRFILASLSPDGERLAFSCGVVHEWVGVFETKSKKLHVITWLFDTPIDQILWSPDSRYFAYAFTAPSGETNVIIVAFQEQTEEPYVSNSWGSGVESSVIISNLQWSDYDKILQFDMQQFHIENGKIITEKETLQTIALKAVKEKEEVKEPPKKVKRTN